MENYDRARPWSWMLRNFILAIVSLGVRQRQLSSILSLLFSLPTSISLSHTHILLHTFMEDDDNGKPAILVVLFALVIFPKKKLQSGQKVM